MVSNDDFDGKATNLNCFYLHINFEQKYPKLAIVAYGEDFRVGSNFELLARKKHLCSDALNLENMGFAPNYKSKQSEGNCHAEYCLTCLMVTITLFGQRFFFQSQNRTRLSQKAYLITYPTIYVRTYFFKGVVADDWNRC